MYVITKVNRYFAKGAEVTDEHLLKADATLEDILNLVKKQKADAEEVLEELDEYGITSIRGYMFEIR